jgi:hypothetical protein
MTFVVLASIVSDVAFHKSQKVILLLQFYGLAKLELSLINVTMVRFQPGLCSVNASQNNTSS